ncbi:hypothetical protein F5050DRAFT_1778753 [Lentinula boryana]|uniref:Uncharacterized protein n=1 Tax=Lentinula boryana TaxID=40481 RepID=A0ABQ8Q5U1_9AGAR|nr:hypothetical protein F5050DRAFT_1778753 [Lentinula boryana]
MVAITFRADSEATPTISPTSILSVTSPSTSSTASSTSSTDLDSNPATQVLTKNLLEWLFLAMAVLVVGSVIHRRIYVLKRNGLSIGLFFSTRNRCRNIGTNPRPTRPFPSTFGSSLSAYDLANVPTAYNPFATSYSSPSPHHRTHIQTRAMDIGPGGRRGRGGMRNDHSETGDQKDTLPAYDKAGSPPGYTDSLPAVLSMNSIGIEQREDAPHSDDPVPDYSLQEEVHDR